MDQSTLTPVQARMARAGLRMTMRQAAELAGLSANTLCKLELGRHTWLPPHIARLVREAYERAGVRFSKHGIAAARRR